MALLSPSILSSDFSDLKSTLRVLEEAGCQLVHLDVMDGLFVPNLTFGPPVIKCLRSKSNLKFDAHLMIEDPEKHIKSYASAGCDIITIHAEATKHLHNAVMQIKTCGVMAGVSINPGTSLCMIEEVLEYVDLVLVMSVNPGFGGQSFIGSSLKKIEKLSQIKKEKNLNFAIEVDGGIKMDNVRQVINSGAEWIVVGSDIFNADNVLCKTKEFIEAINE